MLARHLRKFSKNPESLIWANPITQACPIIPISPLSLTRY